MAVPFHPTAFRAHPTEKMPTSAEITNLPPDGGAEFNRLVFEKSPYLLQHCRNPVDWYPWGEEAFARARAENKAVFLSIGYSTCHWCHVMERESFENDAVAQVMNEYFVCIKVDREERPDIDEIYMNATQRMTGSGGWPNSVWLTPEGKPWYCGTYLPPEDGYGRPGFKTLLTSLHGVWESRRDEVLKQADQLSSEIQRMSVADPIESSGELSRDLVGRALRDLQGSFDSTHGGFGSRPKFPPHGSLNLIFHDRKQSPDEKTLTIATRTLDGMRFGGIHDHVGGGFHRYSTDEEWFLPHFEKMLYDNAQLSRAYVDGHLATGNPDYRQTAVETYEWVLRDMTSPEGGFYSALDADSEGEEGKFYVWTLQEIVEIMGKEDGELFHKAYNVTESGNYHEEATGQSTGANIPFLKHSFNEVAEREKIEESELRSRLSKARAALLEHRNQRVWPHLDDKILTSWNGLMIGSLAYGGKHLDERRYIDAAEKAADFVLTTLRKDGRLLRTYRDGEAKLNAYLDDYAFLADGLLDLHDSTGERRWLDEAQSLMDVVLKHYHDAERGGFFFTSEDHEDLLLRSKDPFDRAIPSGNGVAARTLVRLSQRTGEARYREAARRSLETFQGFMERSPRGTESLLFALASYFDGDTADGQTEHVTDADFHIYKRPVRVEAYTTRLATSPGQSFDLAIRLTLDEGWHVNSHRPIQDYLVATSLLLEDESVFTLGNVKYPGGKEVKLGFNDEALSVYENTASFRVPCTIADGAKLGQAELQVFLRTQACNDKNCLRPETHIIRVPIEIVPAVPDSPIRHASVFGTQ